MKKPPELPAIRTLQAHGYAFIPPSLHLSLRDVDSARPAMNAVVRHIAEGLSDAQHGRVVSNEAMISWLSSWGDNDEQDAPLCRDQARGDGHS